MTDEEYIKHLLRQVALARAETSELRKRVMFWKAGLFTFGVIIIILTWLA